MLPAHLLLHALAVSLDQLLASFRRKLTEPLHPVLTPALEAFAATPTRHRAWRSALEAFAAAATHHRAAGSALEAVATTATHHRAARSALEAFAATAAHHRATFVAGAIILSVVTTGAAAILLTIGTVHRAARSALEAFAAAASHHRAAFVAGAILLSVLTTRAAAILLTIGTVHRAALTFGAIATAFRTTTITIAALAAALIGSAAFIAVGTALSVVALGRLFAAHFALVLTSGRFTGRLC
jgi:hypothetical protein